MTVNMGLPRCSCVVGMSYADSQLDAPDQGENGPSWMGCGVFFHIGSGSQGPIEGAYHRYRFKRDCTEMGHLRRSYS